MMTPETTVDVIAEITAERLRQIEVKGFTPDSDDRYAAMELAGAAACYATHACLSAIRRDSLRSNLTRFVAEFWPWSKDWWKPSSPRRDLIKAAALIIAEIEKIDRKAAKSGEKP